MALLLVGRPPQSAFASLWIAPLLPHCLNLSFSSVHQPCKCQLTVTSRFRAPVAAHLQSGPPTAYRLHVSAVAGGAGSDSESQSQSDSDCEFSRLLATSGRVVTGTVTVTHSCEGHRIIIIASHAMSAVLPLYAPTGPGPDFADQLLDAPSCMLWRL